MKLGSGTCVGDRVRQAGRGQAGAELQGPLFALDDDFVVLALLVDRAGRGTRCCADRAPDDCPDGPADDSTADRAAGLLVTVARGTRHVVFPERFASLDAVVRDGFGLDNSVSHGWISCRGFAPVSAAGECAVRAPPRHEGPSSRRALPKQRGCPAARAARGACGSLSGPSGFPGVNSHVRPVVAPATPSAGDTGPAPQPADRPPGSGWPGTG